MDIAIAVIALPFRAVLWLAKHPKLIVLLAIVIFAVWGVKSCNTDFNRPAGAAVPIEKYQEIEPTVKQAPYVLWTQTRVYYVSKYSGEPPAVTLEKYYTYDNDTWVLQDQPLVITEIIYGEYRIYERKK